MSSTRRSGEGVKEVKGQAYFFSYEEGPPPENHFRVDTLYTGISAGTEATFFNGATPITISGITGLNPAAGEPSIHYPWPFLGYMIGQVTSQKARSVKEGDAVPAALAMGIKPATPPMRCMNFVSPSDGPRSILGIYIAQDERFAPTAFCTPLPTNWLRCPQLRRYGGNGRNVIVIGAGGWAAHCGLFAHRHGEADIGDHQSRPIG
ncbi:MAG: hypothetical protein U0350_17350 [Caldilineaceae bacterium]